MVFSKWICEQIEFVDIFNDNFKENKGQFDIPTNHDANLPPAWLAGYSGKGVVINIVDDGLDHSHSELSNRYVSFSTTKNKK